MVTKLSTFGIALVFVLAILFLIVLRSEGADFDKDWTFEDLTCEELVSGYDFNVIILQDIVNAYNNCLAYADSPAAVHDSLHCALIRKEGEFVKDTTNEMVAAFFAKHCDDK